jgi:hypothetical protein
VHAQNHQAPTLSYDNKRLFPSFPYPLEDETNEAKRRGATKSTTDRYLATLSPSRTLSKMSSDTDSPCQKGALLSSFLWILGIHLLLLPLFARFLNSRRNTRRGTEKPQINVDLVTDTCNIWVITIGEEGTKSYATYTPDFGARSNTTIKFVENCPSRPEGKRYNMCTIDADQRDHLRHAILESSLSSLDCPLPATAILQVWANLYGQGHLNMEELRAGLRGLKECFREIDSGNG